jgi:hypothetical protein
MELVAIGVSYTLMHQKDPQKQSVSLSSMKMKRIHNGNSSSTKTVCAYCINLYLSIIIINLLACEHFDHKFVRKQKQEYYKT